MNIVVVDTETTGLDPAEDRVVELGAVRLIWDGEFYKVGPTRHCFVNPGRSIPAASSAVHHITDADVVDALTIGEALKFVRIEDDDVIVAHNADFDKGFLPELAGNEWVCTWKCANKIYPDAPAFGNQVLRYHLNLEVEGGQGREGMTHSAGYDARTTAALMCELLKQTTLTRMLEITKEPVLLRKVPFGKHRGKSFPEVPADYRKWLLGRPDLDRDLKYTLEYYA